VRTKSERKALNINKMDVSCGGDYGAIATIDFYVHQN
jgi:hypothetical protein